MIIQDIYRRTVAPFPVMRLAADGAVTNFSELVDAGAFRVRGIQIHDESDPLAHVVDNAEAVAELASDALEQRGVELLCDACGASVREWSKVGWIWFTLNGREGYRWYRLCQPCSERCREEEAGKNGPPWVIQLKVLTPVNQREWEFFPFGEFPE